MAATSYTHRDAQSSIGTVGKNRMYGNSQNIIGNIHGDVHLVARHSEEEIQRPRTPTSSTILRRLHYDSLHDRYLDIRDPHEKTFRWMLSHDPSALESQACTEAAQDFQSWLQYGSGIFWLSGKAGSGKSTLTKAIYRDARLQQHLRVWSGGQALLVLPYFFWAVGDKLQRSRDGLLRSLLTTALISCPSVAPIVFPESFAHKSAPAVHSDYRSLRYRLERLLSESRAFAKIFLLIDGLDEFEPEKSEPLHEFLQFLRKVTASSHVKALVAGRPWNEFEHAFRDCPRIRLHELTRIDIAEYVQDNMREYSERGSLVGQHETIIGEIVHAASGVFLWVRIVVESVIQGYIDFDSPADLQRRLQELPEELAELYTYMTRQIAEKRKEQSARYLLIAGYYHDRFVERQNPIIGGQGLTMLDLHFAAEVDSHDLVAGAEAAYPLDDQDTNDLIEQLDGRLKSRCLGLLELQASPQMEYACGEIWPNELPTVRFIHRSAVEFIRSQSMQDELRQYVGGARFCPEVRLLHSYLKQINLNDHMEHAISHLVRASLGVAFEQRFGMTDEVMTLLTEIDQTLTVICESNCGQTGSHWATKHNEFLWLTLFSSKKGPLKDFFSIAIAWGIYAFVKAHVQMAKEWQRRQIGLPLLVVAFATTRDPAAQIVVHEKMIELLLDAEANPNESLVDRGWQYPYSASGAPRRAHTPWQLALYWCLEADWNRIRSCATIMKHFISRGADLDVVLTTGPNAVGVTLDQMISDRFFMMKRDATIEEYNVDLQKTMMLSCSDVRRMGLDLLELIKEKRQQTKGSWMGWLRR